MKLPIRFETIRANAEGYPDPNGPYNACAFIAFGFILFCYRHRERRA